MEVLTSRHEICMKILALKLPFVSFAASKIDCSCLFNTENLGCCLAKAESFIWKNKCSKFGLDIFSDKFLQHVCSSRVESNNWGSFVLKCLPLLGESNVSYGTVFFNLRALFLSQFLGCFGWIWRFCEIWRENFALSSWLCRKMVHFDGKIWSWSSLDLTETRHTNLRLDFFIEMHHFSAK